MVAALNPADVEGYKKFLDYAAGVFHEGYEKLGTKAFLKVGDMLKAAPALAKKSAPSKADGSKGSKHATTGGAAAGLVDHHLGCDLSAKGVTLEPWTSAGVGDVSTSVKAKFKSLGTIRDAADFARFRKLCPKLPDKVSRFVSGPWLGTMSSASLIVATEDVQVHRAYSTPANGTCGTKSQSGEFGSWWSVMPLPAASGREEYRRKMAVCSSWNDFKMKVTCTLKGRSQSANVMVRRGEVVPVDLRACR